MRNRENEFCNEIVNAILHEAARYEVEPDLVMRKVREAYGNKLIAIRRANPENVSEMARLIAGQAPTHTNCRCFPTVSRGVWVAGLPAPAKIIYSGDRTIVMWEDGSKTIVKCGKGEEFSEYSGFVACVAKKLFGPTHKVKKLIDTLKVQSKKSKDKTGKKPE